MSYAAVDKWNVWRRTFSAQKLGRNRKKKKRKEKKNRFEIVNCSMSITIVCKIKRQ